MLETAMTNFLEWIFKKRNDLQQNDLKTPTAGKDAEQPELSSAAGENSK